MDTDSLSAADRIIQSLLSYNDHCHHGRPGLVVPDERFKVGVRWEPVTHKDEGGERVVYRLVKSGKKSERVRAGALQADGSVVEGGRVVGRYQPAGVFPEAASWMYRQVAEVWKLDNEFAARWASHAFRQDHRDLKVALAAFMLCQSRKGDPVVEGGKVVFHDEDYRDVGEAMMLLHSRDAKGLDPKLLLRVRDVLCVEQVAAVNRELGFGRSARNPFLGRWTTAVQKWLRHREDNPRLLDGLVKAGYRTTVMELARRSGYKPESQRFFTALRWRQAQAKDGHRTLAIGQDVAAAETWEGLTERDVCERIVRDKPSYKRIVGLLPGSVGLTRAVMAAAIEAGSLSDKDLIIATPTLEELDLLKVQDVRERWERAIRSAEDMRAANVAVRVKSKEAKEKLQEASDNALKKAVEEVVKNIRVYFFVDVSGSMHGSIAAAKGYIARFLQAFPLDRLHVATFNTQGRVVKIPHPSAAGVENAFRGITASGGTAHRSGILALQASQPGPDEDSLFIFVGDEGEHHDFADAVRASGLRPMAFGMVKVPGDQGSAVSRTAAVLKIPYFQIDLNTFADPYAIPRTIRALVSSTPVGAAARERAPARKTLAEEIMGTDLLAKPAWA